MAVDPVEIKAAVVPVAVDPVEIKAAVVPVVDRVASAAGPAAVDPEVVGLVAADKADVVAVDKADVVAEREVVNDPIHSTALCDAASPYSN